jgi:hypothetical protein
MAGAFLLQVSGSSTAYIEINILLSNQCTCVAVSELQVKCFRQVIASVSGKSNASDDVLPLDV